MTIRSLARRFAGGVFTLALAGSLLTPARGAAQVRDSLGSPALTDTAAAPVPRPTLTTVPAAGSLGEWGSTARMLPDSLFEYLPIRASGDLPRYLGGVFVTDPGLGGYRRKYSVHGLKDGSIAFMSDGIPLNDAATGLWASEAYPAGAASAIEHAPPPAGFLHGFGGTGGVVNFLSPAGRAVEPSSTVRYTQSSYGFSVLDGSLRQDVAGGVNVGLGIQHPVSDGRFDNSRSDGWNGRMKVRADWDGAAVYVSELFTRWERGLNDGVSLVTPESLRFEPIRAIVVNASASEKVVRHDLLAGAAIGTPGGALTSVDLQYGRNFREYRDEASGSGSTGTPFRETREEESYGIRAAHVRRVAGHGLSVMAEARNRRLLREPNIGARRSTQLAAAGTITILLGDVVTLVPGVRLEKFLERERLSLGAEAVVRAGGLLRLSGGLSRSHRFPSFAEAGGVGGLILPLGSPDPERHDVITAGIFAGDPDRSGASLTFFHRRIAGMIHADSSTAGGTPLAWTRSDGETRSGFSLSGSISVWGFRGEVTGERLSYGAGTTRRYAPGWNVGAGIYYDDPAVGGHLKLRAGFRGRYFTRYDGEAYLQRYDMFLPAPADIPPAGTLDFVLFAGIGDAVVHFIWENLLDREYAMTVFYPADDRAIRFGLSWNFLN